MTPHAPQWTEDREKFVDMFFTWFQFVGATRYETHVTQLEHALQTAAKARQDDASEADIVAALLHDVGHLLVEDHQERHHFLDWDQCHEEVGAKWLEQFSPRQVTVPVRLHIPAKRWLCTVDGGYWHGLSEASKHSLQLQGGTMCVEEIIAFEAHPGWQTAVTLRQRDDLAKHSGKRVSGLASYRSVVLHLLRR